MAEIEEGFDETEVGFGERDEAFDATEQAFAWPAAPLQPPTCAPPDWRSPFGSLREERMRERRIGARCFVATLRAIALACAAVACSSGSPGASGPPPTGEGPGTPPATSCPDGFAPDSSGAGCLDVAPSDDCPAGTRAAFGSATCQPVGWTTPSPPGFEPDPSGWGYRDVLPSAPCTGTTYETLGSTECQPIGDCSAAFPPANAAVFVSAAYTASELDATHFKTISGALAVAAAGSVVAVDAGTYPEAVEVYKPVTIVGRCAAQVVVQGPNGQGSNGQLPGFQAVGVSGPIVIAGFTVQGFVGGFIESQSTMSVDACLVTGNSAAGVVADGGSITVTRSRIASTTQQGAMEYAGAFSQDGGKIELTGVALVGNASAGVAVLGPGDAKLTGSIVTGTLVRADNGTDGAGVETAQGGTVEITDSAIVANHTHGVEVTGAGSSATVTGSVLRDTIPDGRGSAYGIQVDSGATAKVDSSRVSGNAVSGVHVLLAGSQITVTNSVVSGTTAAGDNVGAGIITSVSGTLSATNVAVVDARDTGINVDTFGATATVTGSLVRDILPYDDPSKSYDDGNGVTANYGGKLTLTDTTVAQASTTGVEVGSACDPNYPTDCGGQATLSKVVVLSTQPGDKGNAIGLLAEQGAWVSADSCVFAGNAQVGAAFLDPGTTGGLTSTILRATGAGTSTNFGYGLVVLDGASVTVGGSFIRDNVGAGLAFDGAQARVDSSLVFRNPIGVYVANATLDEVATQPDTLGASEVAISATQFIDDETRVSSSSLPLPQEPTLGPVQ